MQHVRFRLKICLIMLAGVLVLGTIGFSNTENLSLGNALYFTIVTISTVGYGDVHAVTPTGKILALIVIITGVATFLGVVANTTELMLDRRERKSRLEKLNIIIGLFFSSLGTRLLKYFAGLDREIDSARKHLLVTSEWSNKDYEHAYKKLQDYRGAIDIDKADLVQARDYLEEKSELLLRIMENPNLLEHETFTDLLMTVFHLQEELHLRKDLANAPDPDREHLLEDMQRAYGYLLRQWLLYMQHLQANYPYLFSLAVRTNPFDKKATPVVQ